MVYVVMGVCGCGKSTIGRLLAQQLEIPFYDGDDYHSLENVVKMSRGDALSDEDREPWLRTIGRQIKKWNETEGAVIACSALKRQYREWLIEGNANEICFVCLQGTRNLLFQRLSHRTGHFMNPRLLDSQIATREFPINAVRVSVDAIPEKIVETILTELANYNRKGADQRVLKWFSSAKARFLQLIKEVYLPNWVPYRWIGL